MPDNNDTPNKSSKPINGKVSPAMESTFESRWHDIETMHERKDLASTLRKLTAIEEELKTTSSGHPDYLANVQREAELLEIAAQKDEETLRSINKQYADIVTTRMSPQNVNTRTTTMSGQHRYYAQARKGADIYRYTEEIEGSIASTQGEIGARGSLLAGRMRGLGEEEMPHTLLQEAADIEKLEQKVAYEKRLLKVQNKAGLSMEKIQYAMDEAMGRTDAYFGEKTITDKVARRDVRTIEEETADLGRRQQDVFIAHERYGQAIEDGAQNMEEFTKALTQSIEALDEQQKLVKEMGRQGIVGPDGPSRAQKFLNRTTAVSGAVGIAANTLSTIQLDYEIEQTQMRTAYANVANRQYQNVDRLMEGDMGALLELTKGDRFQKLYSDRLRTRAMLYKGVEAGTGTVDAAISGAAAGGELTAFWNADVGGSLDKANQAAMQASRSAQMWARLGYGIEQGGYGLTGGLAGRDLAMALNTIPADVMQNYYDVKRGAFDAGVGLGGGLAGGLGRGAMMADVTNLTSLRQFAETGLTHREAMEAVGMAVPQVGVTEDYSDLILRTGRARQRGILGITDYMQNVGQLAGVGGGSADLESIMSKAVTAGMENAKNINQMVDATASLAAGSAAMGISTADAASDMLAASIQSMRALGANRNIATGAAAGAIADADEAASAMGTFADLQYRARMKGIYGAKWGQRQEQAFRMLSPQQMDAIYNQTAEGKRLVEGMGIGKDIGFSENGFNTPADREKFSRAVEAQQSKIVTERLTPIVALSEKGSAEQLRRFQLGEIGADDLSNEAKMDWFRMTGQMAQSYRRRGAEDSPYGKPGDVGFGTVLRGRPAEGNVDAGAFQWQDIIGAQRAADKVREGEKKFGPLGGIPGLVEVMEITRDVADPAKMEEAVNRAAENLKMPTDIFSQSTTRFDGAVDKFILHMKKLGVDVDPGEKPKANTDNIPKARSGHGMSTKKAQGLNKLIHGERD